DRGPATSSVRARVAATAAATTTGGTGAGEANMIAGNGSAGITVTGTPTGTLIQGNNIGVMADGTRNGNSGNGISLFGGSNTTIGGSIGLGRNVISNNGTGIEVSGAAVTGTVIRGNLIGTNLAGTQAQGNRGPGLRVTDARAVTIGGPPRRAQPGRRNVISGNGQEGILLESASDVAIGNNYIGLAANGSTRLANGSHGIQLADTSDVTVGGATGLGNVIAGNSGDGIRVAADA